MVAMAPKYRTMEPKPFTRAHVEPCLPSLEEDKMEERTGNGGSDVVTWDMDGEREVDKQEVKASWEEHSPCFTPQKWEENIRDIKRLNFKLFRSWLADKHASNNLRNNLLKMKGMNRLMQHTAILVWFEEN